VVKPEQHGFARAIGILTTHREDLVAQLQNQSTRANAVELKRELDVAIRVLDHARRLGLSGTEQSWELPECRTATPSSEYRVLEDHETERREHWSEVAVDGVPLRLLPHDLILRKR
jgi:hypothetical protein